MEIEQAIKMLVEICGQEGCDIRSFYNKLKNMGYEEPQKTIDDLIENGWMRIDASSGTFRPSPKAWKL